MCGRFAIFATAAELQRRYDIEVPKEYRQSYNASPGQSLPIVVPESKSLVFSNWGLKPHWMKGKDSAYSMINAKAETIMEKKSYAEAFESSRCIVPVSGFYEWKHENRRKIPYFIRTTDTLSSLAGIYEAQIASNRLEGSTFSII